MKQNKYLIMLLVVLSLGLSSIARAENLTCPGLLTECSLVVEKQEQTIAAQDEQIKTQEELIKIESKEVERLESENKTVRSIAWGELFLLLLLLL